MKRSPPRRTCSYGLLLVPIIAMVALFAPCPSSETMQYVVQSGMGRARQHLGAIPVPTPPIPTATVGSGPVPTPPIPTATVGSGPVPTPPKLTTIRVSQEEINAALRQQQNTLAPLDSVQVRVESQQLHFDIMTYGVHGTITTGMEARQGRPVLVNPQFHAPFGLQLDLDELIAMLESRFARELASSDVYIHAIELEPSTIIVQVE